MIRSAFSASARLDPKSMIQWLPSTIFQLPPTLFASVVAGLKPTQSSWARARTLAARNTTTAQKRVKRSDLMASPIESGIVEWGGFGLDRSRTAPEAHPGSGSNTACAIRVVLVTAPYAGGLLD